MIKKSLSWLGFFLLVLGGISLLIAILYFQIPNKQLIIKKLKQNLQKVSLVTEALDILPNFFEKTPSLVAIFIIDKNQILKGSMYESSHLSEKAYRKWVSQIQNKRSPTPIKKADWLQIDWDKGNVFIALVVRKKITISEAWIVLRNYIHPSIILTYFLIVFFLSISFIIPSFNKKNESSTFFPKDKNKIYLKKITNDDEQEFNIFPDFQNKLTQILNSIHELFLVQSSIIYIYEKGNWNPWYRRFGSISIKSENDPRATELLHKISNLSEWELPITSLDGRLALFPLRRTENLIGALFFILRVPIEKKTKGQIAEKLLKLSTSLYIQRTYDTAVFDSLTHFYNYPYFYFGIQEKLSARGKFQVLLFNIPKLNQFKVVQIEKWSENLLTFLKKNTREARICRLEENRFGILFQEIYMEKVDTLLNYIKHWTKKLLSSPYGVLMISDSEDIDTSSFIKRLELGLLKAEKNKSFGLIDLSIPKEII